MACRQDNYCKSHFHRDDRLVARCNEAIRVVTHAIIGSERLRYTTWSRPCVWLGVLLRMRLVRYFSQLCLSQNANVLVHDVYFWESTEKRSERVTKEICVNSVFLFRNLVVTEGGSIDDDINAPVNNNSKILAAAVIWNKRNFTEIEIPI